MTMVRNVVTLRLRQIKRLLGSLREQKAFAGVNSAQGDTSCKAFGVLKPRATWLYPGSPSA